MWQIKPLHSKILGVVDVRRTLLKPDAQIACSDFP